MKVFVSNHSRTHLKIKGEQVFSSSNINIYLKSIISRFRSLFGVSVSKCHLTFGVQIFFFLVN